MRRCWNKQIYLMKQEQRNVQQEDLLCIQIYWEIFLTICIREGVTPQTLIELWIIHLSLLLYILGFHFAFSFASLHNSNRKATLWKLATRHWFAKQLNFSMKSATEQLLFLSFFESSEHQQVQLQLTRGGECGPQLFNNTSPRDISDRNADVQQCN